MKMRVGNQYRKSMKSKVGSERILRIILFDNRDEIDQFIQRHIWQKLIPEEIDNLKKKQDY
jgi:hypothetical protein